MKKKKQPRQAQVTPQTQAKQMKQLNKRAVKSRSREKRERI